MREIDVRVRTWRDIVRWVRRKRLPLIECPIDAGRRRHDTEVAKCARARGFAKGDYAGADAERMGRRKPNSECLAGQRRKVADDEELGLRPDGDLDRGEGEGNVP